MRYSGKGLMSFCLMLIAIWVVISALKWPFRTALFPVIIGGFVFFMATADLVLSLLSKEWSASEVSGLDFRLSEDIDPALVKGKTLSIFLWVLLFFFLILFVGFHISIPIFFFLFLKFKGKEGWGTSLGLAALAWGSFYGLFIWLLRIMFPEGWLQRGLEAIGIGF